MRKTIFSKIFLLFLINSLFITLLFIFVSSKNIKVNNRQIFIDNLIASAQMSVPYVTDLYLKKDFAALNSYAKDLYSKTHKRITVIDKEGKVLADSYENPNAMDNHAGREEISSLLLAPSSVVLRYSSTLKQEMLYIARPLLNENGEQKAVLRLSVPVRDISIFSSHFMYVDIIAMAAILIISLLMSYLAALGISSRIKKLKDAFNGLAKGNFNIRTYINSGDELQDLSDTFNEMSAQTEKTVYKLEEAKDELQGIISSVSDAILVISPKGEIALINDSFLRSFCGGKASNKQYYWEVLGQGVFDKYLSSDKAENNIPLTFGDKYFLCSLSPVKGGDKFVIVLHNITEIKKLEIIKKDLISNVSHELKTPLSSFKAYLELLEEAEDSEKGQYLEALKRNNDRLSNIVDDLLVLSELENKPSSEYTDFPVTELFAGLELLFKNRAKDKNLKLTFTADKNLKLHANKFRLDQALSNLIGNAIRYTESGFIEVSAEVKGYEIALTVKDSGIGIAEANISRIFERFYVVDKSRSKKTGGTGLGLSITKQIVEQHGGIITVESAPSKGSVFSIILPNFRP